MSSDNTETDLPADLLTQKIGVLSRREAEARILAPIIEALAEHFGRERVVEVVRDKIVEIAKEQGRDLAREMGGSGSGSFLESLSYWVRDDALDIDVLDHDEEVLNFNVKRCRYAEMYRALGIPELGAVFSCNRDFALIDGFNEGAELERTQTIMEGATHCDFRYRFPKK